MGAEEVRDSNEGQGRRQTMDSRERARDCLHEGGTQQAARPLQCCRRSAGADGLRVPWQPRIQTWLLSTYYRPITKQSCTGPWYTRTIWFAVQKSGEVASGHYQQLLLWHLFFIC